MTKAAGTETITFWSRITPWLWRRVYPFGVPAFVRDALQRRLTAVIAALRARTKHYDAGAWAYLSKALHRIYPIDGFGGFIEILQYEIDIAGIRFTVRSTADGVVRCGRGWGGYVDLDRVGTRLGEVDACLEQSRSRGVAPLPDAHSVPADNVYTLDAEKLRILRKNRRHVLLADPVSKIGFAAGDEIVFCGECVKPHLYDSWRGYANRCSCWRGKRTTARFIPFGPPSAGPLVTAAPTWGLRTLVLAVVGAIAVTTGVAMALVYVAASRQPHGSRFFATATVSPEPIAATAVPLAGTPVPFVPKSTAVPVLRNRTTPIPVAAPRAIERAPSPAPTAAPAPEPTAGATFASARPSPIRTLLSSPKPRAVQQPVRIAPTPRPVRARAPVALAVAVPPVETGKASAAPDARAESSRNCATVNLGPTGSTRYNGTIAYEIIRADVTFGDGRKDRAVFPYPWVYADGDDPWLAENASKHPPVTVQSPPSGFEVSSFPDLIQYILKHTRPNGETDLTPCPEHQ